MLRDLTYLFLISLKSKVAFVYLKTVILSNLIGRYHTVAIRVYARLWVRCHTGVKMQQWREGTITSR